MVVVHGAFGLRFIIYLDDHEPPHVQIVGDGKARLAIAGPAGFSVMLSALGIRTFTKRRVMNEVLAQQDVLLAEW